jgi:Crp-like helix-turn-helix domain
MSALSNPFARNRILAGLPSEERRMIEQRSEVTRVYLGDVMDRAGEEVTYLCFPIDAAISMMDMKDRTHTLDVALIGAEGCTGAWVVQGSETSPALNIVEIGGSIVRLPAAALIELLPKLPYVNAVLSRYNLLLMRQIVISVGCSQFHSPEQRIPRWLLDHSHRAGLKEFPFTTEFLSAQVGIDRETTRRALEDLQHRRLIAKGAREVAIVDAEGLARESCACFQLTKDATDGYVEALTRLSRVYSQ